MSTLRKIEGQPNYYKDPTTEIIYYRDNIGGRPLSRSTKETNIAQAKAYVRKNLQLWLGDDAPKSKKVLERLWPEYIEHKKSTVSESTVTGIEVTGKWLMKFWGDKLPANIHESTWEEYLKWAKPQKRVMENDTKWFSNFCHWLVMHGAISRPPRIRNPDVRKMIGLTYSDDELRRLLEYSSPDLRLAIVMGYKMMMRIGEIAGLSWERIDFKKRVLVSKEHESSTKKKRIVPISKGIVFNELFGRSAGKRSPWVFPLKHSPDKHIMTQVFDKEWQAVKRKAKVKGRFHDLKHTGITRLVKLRIPIDQISKVSGTSVPVLMKRYVHTNPEDYMDVVDLVKVEGEDASFGVIDRL
jgi:integrase